MNHLQNIPYSLSRTQFFCGDEQAPYVFEIEDIKYKAEEEE